MKCRKFISKFLVFSILSTGFIFPVDAFAASEVDETFLNNINTAGEGSYPSEFVEYNGKVYFEAEGTNDGEYVGQELWVFDPSNPEDGVNLLEDIFVGSQNSTPSNLTVFGDYLYFSAYTEEAGIDLWRTNGVGAELVYDFCEDGDNGSINSFIDTGDYLYFSANDCEYGSELWRTDGSSVELVSDIEVGESGSEPANYFLASDGLLYFQANTNLYGSELWAYNTLDTNSSAYLIEDITEGEYSSYPRDYAEVDGYLFFVANDNITGAEIWYTDGTPESAVKPYDHTGINDIYDLTELNDILYYRVGAGVEYVNSSEEVVDYGSGTGVELWSYDPMGAPSFASLPDFSEAANEFNLPENGHPVLVMDLIEGVQSAYPNGLTPVGNKLYMIATDSDGDYELYVYDTENVESGITLVENINPDASSDLDELVSFNGKLYFRAHTEFGYELWESSGTPESTNMVTDVYEGILGQEDAINELTEVNGNLFMLHSRNDVGAEPFWLFENEVTLVGDVNELDDGSNDLDSNELIVVNDRVFFSAFNFETGQELYMSDGTVEGTTLLADIDDSIAENGEPNSSTPGDFTLVGDTLFFTANVEGYGQELWMLDTTDETPIPELVEDLEIGTGGSEPNYLVAVGNVLYFSAYDSEFDTELRKYDLDSESPEIELVKDIAEEGGGYPENLVEMNGLVYFSAQSESYGREFWVSDGTQEGTYMILDIVEGTDNSLLDGLTAFNDLLIFSANSSVYGKEVWVSDGTQEGTYMIKDIYEGINGSYPSYFYSASEAVYFRSFNPEIGTELWKTDGTTEGTELVKDINEGTGDSYPFYMVEVDGYIYFSAYNDEVDTQLWKTDGTSEGTEVLTDAEYGMSMDVLVAAGQRIYFSAYSDSENGDELWVSDGTSDGTYMYASILDGSASSSPHLIGVLSDKIFFYADNGVYGEEPYVVARDNSIVDSDSTPASGGGSSSGSRVAKFEARLTYEQEVAKILAKGIVTENPQGLTNKCEALVMMQRVFEWKVPAATGTKYNDVPTWCTDVAAFGTDRGIVEGRAVDRLGMETPVTRHEVALMIYRELKLQNYKFGGSLEVVFTDSVITWAKEAVEVLAKEGIIKGFADGTFGGDKNILKQDLGVMLLRVKDLI